ncbi:MAG: hypothetical protein QNJ97_17625 [Myxococcota bacterium]|nr:hypothetical protein [Myxococcota bacterium]
MTTGPSDCSLILGAASRIGAALVQHIVSNNPQAFVIAADLPEKRGALNSIKISLGQARNRIAVVAYHPQSTALGFDGTLLARIKHTATHIYHLAHQRDRSQKASLTREHNKQLFDKVLTLSRQAVVLKALVVVTDVGMIGDYPGRFSENWVDVGQIPFDEVDQSSVNVERACIEATDVPIVRGRVGLVSDVGPAPAPAEVRAHWRPTAEILLPSIRLLKVLPRFLSIWTTIPQSTLAPLTPVPWAGSALAELGQCEAAIGHAVHLVISPPPTMRDVLAELTRQYGGARIKGGLSIDLLKRIGKIPGLTETVRRQADHVASFWVPHRYCLSRNELDTANASEWLRHTGPAPTWEQCAPMFFNWKN